MVVADPPQSAETEELAERLTVEALRERALIEEARARTRRRRRGYAVAALVGLAVAVGLGRAAVERMSSGADSKERSLLGASAGAGGQIAIADGGTTLQVVNADGSGLRPVVRCPADVEGCGILEPAWSPEGARLAFVRGRTLASRLGPHPARPDLSLYVLDAAARRSGSLPVAPVPSNTAVISPGRPTGD